MTIKNLIRFILFKTEKVKEMSVSSRAVFADSMASLE